MPIGGEVDSGPFGTPTRQPVPSVSAQGQVRLFIPLGVGVAE
jgi:hypothetical protein